MHIGLVVGIGPAATDFYYRSLIRRMAQSHEDLDLTMVHADTPTLLANQAEGGIQAQVAIYDTLTQRLRAAGARTVAVTSIAGHFCIRDFERISVLPVIDLLRVVGDEVAARGYLRVGIMGTRGVMTSHFYGALGDVDVLTPIGEAQNVVHDTYVEIATTAQCSARQRQVFFDAGHALVDNQGAEVVLLAGTDLALAFNGLDPGFPVLDCAQTHVDAIAAEALRN